MPPFLRDARKLLQLQLPLLPPLPLPLPPPPQTQPQPLLSAADPRTLGSCTIWSVTKLVLPTVHENNVHLRHGDDDYDGAAAVVAVVATAAAVVAVVVVAVLLPLFQYDGYK